MSVLTRPDGQAFIINAYRETLVAQTRSELAQKIRLHAHEHGHHVLLQKSGSGQYEVAYSHDPGYLLGESIWHHFGQPSHLIFCEVMPDQTLLLVIVRDSVVYLASKISKAELSQELLWLRPSDEQYQVVVVGDMPMLDQDSDGKLLLSDAAVKSFDQQTTSVFNRVVPPGLYELQPLAIALRVQNLSVSRPAWVTLSVAVFLMMSGGFWAVMKHEPAAKPTVIEAISHNNSDAARYQRALSTPAPAKLLAEASRMVDRLYLLPGWSNATVRLSHNDYTVRLKPHRGNIEMLTQWAHQRNMHFELTTMGATLSRHSDVPVRSEARAQPHAVAPVTAALIDRMDYLLHDDAVKLINTVQHGDLKEQVLTVNLKEVSPQVLELLSQELEGLPVVMDNVDIQFKAGLINGNIRLAVWGK